MDNREMYNLLMANCDYLKQFGSDLIGYYASNMLCIELNNNPITAQEVIESFLFLNIDENK